MTSDVPSSSPSPWRSMHAAPKDGSPVLGLFKQTFASPHNDRAVEQWGGTQIVMRHPGLTNESYDCGWNLINGGTGGFPDDWFEGWMPLPVTSASAASSTGALREALSAARGNLEEIEVNALDVGTSNMAQSAIMEIDAALTASPAPSTEGTGPLKLDTETQVFFYEQDFYVLSNFSSFSLWLAGDRFATSEAAYHYEKFPDATAIQQQILSAPSAHVAFKIAEANKAFRRADWDDVKVDVMRRILREKVRQHEYVRRKLLDTGDRELIENSWRDDFWGWGPNRDGQNMLGKLWMEIRAELRAAPDAARTALAGVTAPQTDIAKR